MSSLRERKSEVAHWFEQEGEKIRSASRETLDHAQEEFNKVMGEAQDKYFAIVTPIQNEMDKALHELHKEYTKKINAIENQPCVDDNLSIAASFTIFSEMSQEDDDAWHEYRRVRRAQSKGVE